MRVTNMHMVDLAQAGAAQNQSNVATLSQEVQTGLRVAKPSDDPTAWIEAQREKVRSALNDGTSEAIQSSSERLTSTDGALATLSSIVSQAQALAVQGSNASQNASTRAAIGAEMTSLFQAAVTAGNTKGVDGSYLLAGTAVATQPFDPTTGAYQGNAGVNAVNTDTAATEPAAIAGSALTAANGVDVIPTLSQLATALNGNNLAGIQSAITSLNTAVSQLATTRSQAGGMMAALNSAKSSHDSLSTQLSTSISDYTEVDVVQAASDLSKASTALQVSQAVTTKVLSLLSPVTA
jgi:flagellar hook-associated protein 3 FlgL